MSLKTITLTSPNAQTGGLFGSSVAASGGIIVVGAKGENSFAGHAYVFNGTGSLISTLSSPNSQSGGDFGFSVAVGNGVVVVGAPFETVGTNATAGHAYIFNETSSALIKTLTSPKSQGGGEFGLSVVAGGGVVVVGAPYETHNSSLGAEGYAYKYTTSGVLRKTLSSPNAEVLGWFGYSVAVGNGVIAVGAIGETVKGNGAAGHAYTFNSKTNALISTLTSPNNQSGGQFGYSVGVGSGVVAVGAPYENSSTGNGYTFNATNGKLISTLPDPNAGASGYFGWSVGASSGIVIVGAYSQSVNGYAEGRAYTYNPKTGALLRSLVTPQGKNGAGGFFGWSVAAQGRIPVVGAPEENAGAISQAGHAYIF